MNILCRMGIHSMCRYYVGEARISGFCCERVVHSVCRRCGKADNYIVVMIGNSELAPSKDAARADEYLANGGR